MNQIGFVKVRVSERKTWAREEGLGRTEYTN